MRDVNLWLENISNVPRLTNYTPLSSGHHSSFKQAVPRKSLSAIARFVFSQANLSYRAGKNFASKHSEAMFLPGLEPEKVRKEVDDIR